MQSTSQITIEKLKNILIKKCKDKDRIILAIAGPPESGKSTLAKNISGIPNLITYTNKWKNLITNQMKG
jgi:pantothenate kinase